MSLDRQGLSSESFRFPSCLLIVVEEVNHVAGLIQCVAGSKQRAPPPGGYPLWERNREVDGLWQEAFKAGFSCAYLERSCPRPCFLSGHHDGLPPPPALLSDLFLLTKGRCIAPFSTVVLNLWVTSTFGCHLSEILYMRHLLLQFISVTKPQ